jgi:hypothetical protein
MASVVSVVTRLSSVVTRLSIDVMMIVVTSLSIDVMMIVVTRLSIVLTRLIMAMPVETRQLSFVGGWACMVLRPIS